VRSLKIVQECSNGRNVLLGDEHRLELERTSNVDQRGYAQVSPVLDAREIGAGDCETARELALTESEALTRCR